MQVESSQVSWGRSKKWKGEQNRAREGRLLQLVCVWGVDGCLAGHFTVAGRVKEASSAHVP